MLGRVAELAARVAPAHRWALVTDGAVGPLHADRVLSALPAGRALRLEVPPGEAFKTRESWGRLTDELLAAGCGRDTTVIARPFSSGGG